MVGHDARYRFLPCSSSRSLLRLGLDNKGEVSEDGTGDMVLLNNYKCMHDQNVFDHTRKHRVAWFEGWEVKEDMRRSHWKEEAAVPF